MAILAQVGQTRQTYIFTGADTPSVKPLTIACQDGAIVLDSVTPEGGKSMAGTAWAAGRRLKAGDSL